MVIFDSLASFQCSMCGYAHFNDNFGLSLLFFFFLVGEARAWANAGQPNLADRRKWPTPTTTRMVPIHQPRAQRRHHKERQVREQQCQEILLYIVCDTMTVYVLSTITVS